MWRKVLGITVTLCLVIVTAHTAVAQTAGVSSGGIAEGPTVYAGGDGGLVAVDASSGEVVWHWQGASATDPTVVDGVVYTGANESVYAFDAVNGSVLWRYFTGGEVRASPTVVDGRVYLPTGDLTPAGQRVDRGGYLYMLSATDGRLLWNRSVATTSRSPDVVEGTVYLSDGERVSALDARDGTLLWRRDVNGTVGRSSVAISDTVFSTLREGAVLALNASDGETRWRYDVDEHIASAPVFTDGSLYMQTLYGPLYALNGSTGQVEWRRDINGGRSSVTVANGTVYATGDAIHAVAARDGAEGWRFEPATSGVLSTPAVSGEMVYIGAEGSSTLLAIDRTSGSLRWNLSLEYFRDPSPTLVEKPENGDSVDSRVALGTYGHHDAYAAWAANQTVAHTDDVGDDESSGNADETDEGQGDDDGAGNTSSTSPDGTEDGQGLPGFTAVAAVVAVVAGLMYLVRR